MPPPPTKRKWHPRKPANNNTASGSASNASTAPGTPTALAQQPKRPRVENAAPKPEGGVDVKQMYSTSAGGDSAKPFSALSGKLDKALLDGLDKMGFEYDFTHTTPYAKHAC